MNYRLVVRAANCYLLTSGYQVYWYEVRPLRCRLSLWATLYIVALLLLYATSFGHHFEQSALLLLLRDLSPLLHRLTRIQLWLGLKAVAFFVFEWRRVRKVASGLLELLSDSACEERSDRYDLVAYCFLLSTLLVALSFAVYIAVELEFRLPSVDNVLVGTALFLPHLMAGGALRLYSVGVWLMRHELRTLAADLYTSVCEKFVSESGDCIVLGLIDNSAGRGRGDGLLVNDQLLNRILARVELLCEHLKHFDRTLQKQLALLIGLNFNCLLAAVYTRVCFTVTWHVMFSARNTRVFYAANAAIFVCISSDYLVLCLAQISFDKVKRDFCSHLACLLRRSQNLPQDTYRTLLNIHMTLSQQMRLKLFGIVDLNVWNFLQVQCLMGTVIAAVVTIHYFNDQLAEIGAHLNSADLEE